MISRCQSSPYHAKNITAAKKKHKTNKQHIIQQPDHDQQTGGQVRFQNQDILISFCCGMIISAFKLSATSKNILSKVP